MVSRVQHTQSPATCLHLSECPFLQGRGFVFASQFSRLLPQEIAGSYLDAAIRVIENDGAQIPIKASAVKAIQKYVLLPIS